MSKTGCLDNGIVYGYYFENMVAGKIYRLDFVYSVKNIIPALDSNNFNISPGVAVNNIYLRNDGDAPVRYSLNAENENVMQGGVITKGFERSWTTYDKIIKSVNFQIYGNSGNTTKLAIEVGI